LTLFLADAHSVEHFFSIAEHFIQGKLIFCERARSSSRKNESQYFKVNDASTQANSQNFSAETSPTSGLSSQNICNNSQNQGTAQYQGKRDGIEGVPSPNYFSQSHVDRRIWIGGISKSLSDHELADFFNKFGDVEQAFIVTDDRGRSKGFAYVTFSSVESASRVLNGNSVKIGERFVTVKAALPEAVMNKNKIYVCGLGDETIQQDVFDYFQTFGTVVEAIIKDAGSHRFAFVRFGKSFCVFGIFLTDFLRVPSCC
jgi:hypothetical protein